MLIQVQSVTPTKSGKGYMVNGKYFASIKIGIEQNVGKQIEAVLGSFKSTTGVNVETIDGFTVSTAQPTSGVNLNSPVGMQSYQAQAQQAPYTGLGGIDRWWLPFVSNQCAHAIQSGLITSGDDLIKWANFAKLAAMAAGNAVGPEGVKLGDEPGPDIPF